MKLSEVLIEILNCVLTYWTLSAVLVFVHDVSSGVEQTGCIVAQRTLLRAVMLVFEVI